MRNIGARDYRLDLLKAVAITFVLIWHLKPVDVTAIPAPATVFNGILEQIPIVLGIFYYQVTLIGVPLFIIVSLYLFYGKIGADNYFRKRMIRILQIFAFWAIVQCGIYLLLKILINAGKIGGISIVLPPFQLGQAIIMGGPDLPIAGGSVFYFLFDLILLYILAYGYYRLKDTIRRPLGLLVIIISMVYFQYCIFSRRAVAFWRLENFLIYVPIAYFLRFSDGFPKLKNFFLLGFIIFSVEESMVALRMHFLGYGVLYDRVSIAIGATAITSVILEASKLAANEKKSDFIRLLSVYSLGIFALHKYWVLLVNLMFLELFINGFSNQSVNVQIFNLNLDALQLIKVAAEVAFTLLSVYLLGRTPLKKYVS